MIKEELTKLLIESYDRGVEDAKQEALAALEKTVAVMVAAQTAQQEPVGWWDDKLGFFAEKHFDQLQPIYKFPPAQPQQEYERGFIDGMQKQMQSSVDWAVNAMAKQTAQQEPVYHLRQYGDVTKEQLDRYMATGDINPQPAQQEPVGDEWTPCMKLPVVVHVRKQRLGEAHVSTREGITPVKPDDLIMRGVSGEEYPIGRSIFEQTYSLDTAQPQRKPLTDDEIYGMYNEPRSDAEMVEFARAIEAAHGIKENT